MEKVVYQIPLKEMIKTDINMDNYYISTSLNYQKNMKRLGSRGRQNLKTNVAFWDSVGSIPLNTGVYLEKLFENEDNYVAIQNIDLGKSGAYYTNSVVLNNILNNGYYNYHIKGENIYSLALKHNIFQMPNDMMSLIAYIKYPQDNKTGTLVASFPKEYFDEYKRLKPEHFYDIYATDEKLGDDYFYIKPMYLKGYISCDRGICSPIYNPLALKDSNKLVRKINK